MSTCSTAACGTAPSAEVLARRYPLDRWYVAGFADELRDQPLARRFLDQPVVMFRTPDGRVAALEDRCCHRSLPLSFGTVEAQGLRCGYHGLLFDAMGRCMEIPGQAKVPPKAQVRAYHLREKDHILWIWMPRQTGGAPSCEPPDYPIHDDPRYRFGYGSYHYNAPWQLIHDNLLDLSHLGYVHLKTIGGNARLHMNAPTRVGSEGERVSVIRHMAGSTPPPTYQLAWPFGPTCDRWQEIVFHPSHLTIWTGAMAPGEAALDDPARGGFHMRGFHGITPESETTAHYFWSMSANRHPDLPDTLATVVDQTRLTFDEDKGVIEGQWQAMQRSGGTSAWVDIHTDAGGVRARRVIAGLIQAQQAQPVPADRVPA